MSKQQQHPIKHNQLINRFLKTFQANKKNEKYFFIFYSNINPLH